jgi:hypothetical protein
MDYSLLLSKDFLPRAAGNSFVRNRFVMQVHRVVSVQHFCMGCVDLEHPYLALFHSISGSTIPPHIDRPRSVASDEISNGSAQN